MQDRWSAFFSIHRRVVPPPPRAPEAPPRGVGGDDQELGTVVQAMDRCAQRRGDTVFAEGCAPPPPFLRHHTTTPCGRSSGGLRSDASEPYPPQNQLLIVGSAPRGPMGPTHQRVGSTPPPTAGTRRGRRTSCTRSRRGRRRCSTARGSAPSAAPGSASASRSSSTCCPAAAPPRVPTPGAPGGLEVEGCGGFTLAMARGNPPSSHSDSTWVGLRVPPTFFSIQCPPPFSFFLWWSCLQGNREGPNVAPPKGGNSSPRGGDSV